MYITLIGEPLTMVGGRSRWKVPLVGGLQLFLQTKAGFLDGGENDAKTAVVFSSRMLLLLPSRQRKQHHKRQNESQGENDEKDQ